MRIAILSMLLLAPSLAAAQDASPRVDAFTAGAPDADLQVPLRAVLLGPDGPARWVLDAEAAPPNASAPLRWSAGGGEARVAAMGAPWAGSFLAKYGPGSYRLTLTVATDAGSAQSALDLAVPEVRNDTAAVNLTIPPADSSEPTTLRLANDTVNADGKAKSPGADLITRVVVGDADGLGDVRRVTFAYARLDPAGRVPVALRVLERPGASGTSLLVEDRFNLAPMRDGTYVANVTAEGTGRASVERTFVVTDAASTASLSLAPGARAGAALRGELVVEDRNFGTGPLDGGDVRALPALHAQVYRGSARVDDAGWVLAIAGQRGNASLDLDLRGEGTRSTRFPYEAGNGAGRLRLPVEVQAPAAAEGTYRLGISAAGTLASASFDVLPAPRVVRAAANGTGDPGSAVTVEADVAGTTEPVGLVAPWGTFPAAPDASGHVRAVLRLPERWPAEGGALTLVLPGGEAGRTVALPGRNLPPTLDARLGIGAADLAGEAWLHPNARGELRLRWRADDANAARVADEVGPVRVEVRDWQGRAQAWNGTGEWPVTTREVALQPPADAERGRYTVRLSAADRQGALAQVVLPLNLGLRFRIALDAPGELALENGTANLTVRAAGNGAVRALDVLLDGLPASGEVRAQLPNGSTLRAPLVAGRAHLEAAPLLRPSERAGLVVALDALPEAPLRVRLVVAAEAL